MKDYFVYILSNNAQVLYIGVTSDLNGRLFQHIRERAPASFAARYNLDRLVFHEVYPTALEAIAREKQLKGWTCERKKKLIFGLNPTWRNLLEDHETWDDGNTGRQLTKAGRTDPSTSSG